MTRRDHSLRWGEPPWRIDFVAEHRPAPEEADVAIIGGGFTGLAAAAWLCHLAPRKTVTLIEARRLGAGASGRTGGIVLAETAAGDLPGLGDVLSGFSRIIKDLEIHCDLSLPGAWEIARRDTRSDSQIDWQDSGKLRVANEVPGGTVDAGKLVSGLADAAQRLGAVICEQTLLRGISFEDPLRLELSTRQLRAHQVLLATNAFELELSGLVNYAQPKFTFAVATAALEESRIESIGLAQRKPFYTIDLPYLWGRVLTSNQVIFGGGLTHPNNWREMEEIDITSGQPAELLAALQQRVRGFHPALRRVEFTHRWGGPILFARSWRPLFQRHARSDRVLVLGGYSGHGVALSAYLGSWAAQALLGQQELPDWGGIPAVVSA